MVGVHGQRGIDIPELRHLLFHDDQLLRMAIGQRFQEHVIHQGKNRGRCPDAQRQCQDGGDGKPGRLAQLPYRIAQVIDKCLHRTSGDDL